MPDSKEIRELIGVCRLNSTPCKYLLDTGASRTVIHERVLSAGDKKNVQPSPLRVVVADNTDCFVVGILAVNIEFGNHLLSEEVLVVKELTHDCLLGMDVLMKHPVTREVMCHLETVVKIRLSNLPNNLANQRPGETNICVVKPVNPNDLCITEGEEILSEPNHPGTQIDFKDVFDIIDTPSFSPSLLPETSD